MRPVMSTDATSVAPLVSAKRDWQGCRESNPSLRFWRPLCCRNTSPQSSGQGSNLLLAGFSRTLILSSSQRETKRPPLNRGWPEVLSAQMQRTSDHGVNHRDAFVWNMCCAIRWFSFRVKGKGPVVYSIGAAGNSTERRHQNNQPELCI